MIVGRADELSRIDHVLQQAREGRSGCLVLRGDPGIGKTSLLDAAAERASDFTVLRACGVELEAELPYSALLELLRPIAAGVDRLPEPHAAALRGALALGPTGQSERFAVCAATLGLLAAASDEGLVLVLIDDAQWIDAPSGEALAFAARRLRDEGLAVLWATRTEDALAFSLDGLTELRLGGLDRSAVGDLLDAAGTPAVSPRAVDALVDATGGNPLALLEIPELLSEHQRAGAEPIDQPLPVGPAVERAFGRRLERLPETTRSALLIAAVSASRELGTIERALAFEDLTLEALVPAENDEIIAREGGRLEFAHPLVRAAVHARATAAARRAAHSALASALADGAREDERAWHRALAAPGPDDVVAAELEAVGIRARKTSWRAAARAFERSAQLTSDGEARGRRLLAAARAAYTGGTLDTAARLADDATRLLQGDAAGHAEAKHLSGRILAGQGEFRPAALNLEEAAGEIEATDPERAALMLGDAVVPWLELGEHGRAARAAARAWELPWPRGGHTELALSLTFGDALAERGRLSEAIELWLRGAAVPGDADPEALTRIAEAILSAGEHERARAAAERAVERARECSALGVLTISLGVQVFAEARTGRLRAAARAAEEAIDLVRALGQRGELIDALHRLAWVDAMLGREQECRRHAAEATEELTGLGTPESAFGPAVGLLELSLGRAEEAVEALERTTRARGKRMRADAMVPRPVLANLIEAYVRAGRVEDARPDLEELRRQAELSELPFVLAIAARCRGIVEGEEQHFVDALAWHERQPNAFERGRTLFCFGELLRRKKRRADARTRLRAALADFEEVGAEIWAERARRELGASGERARRRTPDTRDELTPQEVQVAGLVAEGLTNREIAARLFLSPKTIETHIRHAFQKLGVRSRTELAVAVTSGDGEAAVSA
jgi:DNA-binding CsgD family transcriptional regulator